MQQKSTIINKTNDFDLIHAKFIGKPINLSKRMDVFRNQRFFFDKSQDSSFEKAVIYTDMTTHGGRWP